MAVVDRSSDPELAGAILRRWMADSETSGVALQKNADLPHSSSISRLLRAKRIPEESIALRIWLAVRFGLEIDHAEQLLNSLGIKNFWTFLTERQRYSSEIHRRRDAARAKDIATSAATPRGDRARARQTLLGWLDSTPLSQNRLQEEAGLRHSSSITKFIKNGVWTEPGARLRLWLTVRPRMSCYDAEVWLNDLEIATLWSFVMSKINGDSTPDWRPGTSLIEFASANSASVARLDAERRFDQARTAAALSWNAALPYFHDAETAAINHPSLAAAIALERAQVEINLGQLSTAETTLRKVEANLGSHLDPRTRWRLLELFAWRARYQGQHELAMERFKQCLQLAESINDPDLFDSPHHFISQLLMARQRITIDGDEARSLARQAERHHDLSYKRKIARGVPDEVIAFEMLSAARIAAALGYLSDKRKYLREARALFGNSLGRHHVSLSNAEMGLDRDSDTRGVLAVSKAAAEDWAKLGYASGVSRALMLGADASMHSGSHQGFHEALESAIAARLIFPHGHYDEGGRQLRVLTDLRGLLISEGGFELRDTTMGGIVERAHLKLGAFRYLNLADLDRTGSLDQAVRDMFRR